MTAKERVVLRGVEHQIRQLLAGTATLGPMDDPPADNPPPILPPNTETGADDTPPSDNPPPILPPNTETE